MEAARNLCLGQDGPLSVGSARGHMSMLQTTDLHFVLRVAFSGADRSENSWRWWLGRLNFLDNILSQFSQEFLQCVIKPPGGSLFDDGEDSSHSSGMVSPSDSITSSAATSVMSEAVNDSEVVNSDVDSTILRADELENLSEQFLRMDVSLNVSVGSPPGTTLPGSPELQTAVEGNLLMQAWFFAARATHITQGKLGRMPRRVVIKIAKVLRDDPLSLEVAHTVVAQCHRTHAEGLLDRVLQAREDSSRKKDAKEGQGRAQSSKVERRLDMDAGEAKRVKLKSPVRSAAPKASNAPSEVSDSKSFLLNVVAAPKVRSLSPSALTGSTPPLSCSPIMAKKNLQHESADNSSGGSWMEDDALRQERGVAGSLSRPLSQSDRKRMSRQKSRSSVKNVGVASDDFVESDESFRSALSDFDPDCSSETVVLQEALEREREEGEGSSGSHDSRRSNGREKQQSSASSSSGGSGGRGQDVVGPVPGFVKST